MRRVSTIAKGMVALSVLMYALWLGYKWTVMRVFVPPGSALMVINKFGKALPPDLIVVPPGTQYKGIQQDLLGPGRYFIDPIRFETKLVPLVTISAGDPAAWEWDAHGRLKNPTVAPELGLVTCKQGKSAPAGQEVVEEGYKGIQREVLTPGVYKLNPALYEVTIEHASIIPPGSVGVVTQLHSQRGPNAAGAGQILPEVLQAGIYYLNPRLMKITVVPVGYDVITLEAPKDPVRFISADGYQIEADFTVVWGRTPADAPQLVANIGDSEKVEKNVIEPAMSSMCRNVGGRYTARQLIEGETRIQFQDDLSKSLKDQIASRNVEILLTLVRNVTVKDTAGRDATDGLLQTIQKANIEYERELTNKQKTETAASQAELEQWLRDVDVQRQKITSETMVKVAKLEAEVQKKAAQIDAEREKAVAEVKLQIAQIESERTRALSKAQADVERMKNEAEAKGAKMLIDAFGSPMAYNQYIFAKYFEPQEIRLIFAGPGTFWTDLKSFEQIGAARMMQQPQPQLQPQNRKP